MIAVWVHVRIAAVTLSLLLPFLMRFVRDAVQRHGTKPKAKAR